MPTNPNMVAIRTVTVGSGGAANIEFTSIPQTYTDLVVKLSARSTSTNTFENYILTFNGSSQTGMSGRHLYGTGSAAGSGSYSSGDGSIFSVPANVTASTFGNAEIYIPNYTSSNNKSISIDNVSENNATAGQQNLQASLWSNSAAITSIRFALSGGNYAQYSTATLYGVTSSAYGAKATGGIISSDETYWYHTFTSSDTFTPTQNLTADYLVVAGGGGGASQHSGGGGAGGLRCTVGATGGGGSLESALSLTASTNYTVTVGAGGAGGTTFGGSGSNGSNSVFSSITSTGGGGGGVYGDPNGVAGSSGGSGGGGGAAAAGSGGAGGARTTNQGYAGGAGVSAVSGSYKGGGGGGAGSVGETPTAGANTSAGNGGSGVTTSISGSAVAYAGGGGAGLNGGSGSAGTATDGGGAGAKNTGTPTAGTANRGGGGGSSGQNSTAGAAGGSGIVIVRYAK